MRIGMVALILGFAFNSCSKPKTHQRVDPVLVAAGDLLAVPYDDARALEKIKTLEIEIEKAKHMGTARDIRGLPLYERAIEMFRLSRQRGDSKSEEIWIAAVAQLHKAQRERTGLRDIHGVYFDPPMPKPVKPQPSGYVR